MERMWAPWRGFYVRESAAGRTHASNNAACFICNGLASTDDRTNLVLWRRPNSVVYLNRFPYNNGHLLVAPVAHVGPLTELTGPSLFEPLETLQRVVGILERVFRPNGFNIGLNLGTAAGAGVPGHLHWHVVPRWDGDTNFMPVLANSKVIVDSLFESYDQIQAALPTDQ